MKKIVYILFFAIGINTFAQPTSKIAKSPTDFVPTGYVVFEEIRGDLNKDHQIDHVFIIKGTDKNRFVNDKRLGLLDRNRRGIIIVLKNQDQYELALENRNCFSSENEEGGDYFAPELNVSINKGNILIHYAHGRYGYWSYNFRYQNSDFEMIGYDSSQNRGPVVESLISINFMTKKMVIRENTNENATGGDEKFKENWKKITPSKPIKLMEIDDFDSLGTKRLLGR